MLTALSEASRRFAIVALHAESVYRCFQFVVRGKKVWHRHCTDKSCMSIKEAGRKERRNESQRH